MKLLLISAGNVGHSIETAVSFHKSLLSSVEFIDTLTPFSECFEDSDNNANFYLPSKNENNKVLKTEEKILFCVDFIGYIQKKYDLIVFLTFDELYTLSTDSIILLSNVVDGTPITGIYYSSSYWRIKEKRDWCFFREKKLSLLNIPVVFSPDPFLEKKLLSYKPFFKMKWLPDFTTASTDQSSLELVNSILSKKKGRLVIGLVGSLGKWKGVLELVNLLNNEPNITRDFLFVVAGEFVKDTFSISEINYLLKTFDEFSDEIIRYDNTIDTNLGFNAVIDECDILLCLYNNPQSSGLLSKGLLLNKVVVGYEKYVIGDIVSLLGYSACLVDKLTYENLLLVKQKIKERETKYENKICESYKKLLSPSIASDIFIFHVLMAIRYQYSAISSNTFKSSISLKYGFLNKLTEYK